ncbi:MAG: kelch repeat-containing protein [Acidobacteriota bacterium]
MLVVSWVAIVPLFGAQPPSGSAARVEAADDNGTAFATGRGDLIAPRYGASATSDGRWVYVYGGAPSGSRNGPDFMHPGLHSSIERIDPTSLESTYFSNGLHRRANHASVLIAGALVSCGGRTQVGLTRARVSSCETLDFESGIFRELPALPEALRTLGMAELDGVLYAIGGLTNPRGFSKSTFRLRQGSESAWERLAELPVPRQGEIVAVAGKLWAIGGYNGSAMRSVLVFNPGTGRWEQREDLPYALSAFSAVADGDSIYLFGDYEQMSAVHRYTTPTGRFERLELEITPRRHSAAVVIAGRALVIGGNQQSSGPATTLIEAFELEDLRSAAARKE